MDKHDFIVIDCIDNEEYERTNKMKFDSFTIEKWVNANIKTFE